MNLSYWRKDWFIGLLVALIFFVFAVTDSLRGLDLAAYDWGVRFSSSKKANQNVVVIAIDDAALQQMGSWPWPRDIMASLTRKIVAARPKVIGYALSFDTRQSGHSLDALSELKSAVNQSSAIRLLLRKVEAGLNTDHVFARSLKRAGRIVMAVPYQLKTDADKPDELQLDDDVKRYGIPKVRDKQSKLARWFTGEPVPVAGQAFPPILELSRFAGALGHIQLDAPRGTSGRIEPLVLKVGDIYLPSFALMMAVRSKGLMSRHIKVDLSKQISIPGFQLHTDRNLQLYSSFYSGQADAPPFKVYSILDVLNDKVPGAAFRNKSLLIGLTARQQANLFDTPLGNAMPPVIVAAHRVSSLLNGDIYQIPEWSGMVELLVIVVIGLYLVFILPRFRVSTGLALSVLLFVILFNVHFIFMLAKATWIPLMLPVMALILGHAVLGGKHLLEDVIGGIKAELSDANRALGQSFQSQGQLDQAFEKYRHCVINKSMFDLLYNLGLDYERKRQFNKAVAVFKLIAEHDDKYSDVTDRIQRNQEVTNTLVMGGNGGNSAANGTLILSNPGVQKPMLGRYQIDKELGRGAMGMVYLGHDPKIDRTVAIKTMVLAQEFEGEQLEEVKKRFFREAETAGRLNHPHIVTIYDVGEDQDLSYIAMDYLKGVNLLTHCKMGSLLPAKIVFKLIMQVADALDYAHKQNVVHRDIKPANIIYDEETETLNVTDFGVAFVTDASKTKTGTILGSPSYMSPEQLAGKKVDGRSDLFSLGVTFYQMLTGELPFIGESLASLMYKIANEKHPDVRMFRPDLPACVSKLINKALHKDIERRFQSGEKMTQTIQRCLERL